MRKKRERERERERNKDTREGANTREDDFVFVSIFVLVDRKKTKEEPCGFFFLFHLVRSARRRVISNGNNVATGWKHG